MTPRSGVTRERAPAVLDEAPAPVEVPTRSKRRSRKRVGDALILWMEANSGWHHEDALLQVVIEDKRTVADIGTRSQLRLCLQCKKLLC